MRVLVLGGTGFLGKAFVETALADGHRVAIANRGLTNPDLFRRPSTCRSTATPDQFYGPLKVRCESEVRESFPRNALVVRPGFIVGPSDTDDRLLWWLRRCARGGEVVAPVAPTYGVQLIDARDLAEWVFRSLDVDLIGTFNAVGTRWTMGALLDACVSIVGGVAQLRWVAEEHLLAHGAQPWESLPFWLGDERALTSISFEAAARAGLVHRPLEDTLLDVWNWDAARGRPTLANDARISEEMEAAILATRHERNGGRGAG